MRTIIRARLLFILMTHLLILGPNALADFKEITSLQSKLETSTSEPPFQVFVISTEMQIGKARPIFEAAPEGIYLTVGTERGFRGASLSPHVSHLVLLDISPKLIRFNQINIELLKSPLLSEYKKLRWDSSYTDWTEFSKRVGRDLKVNVHLTQDDFNWWKENVRNFESFKYPLPEFLNRYGKDLLLEPFLVIFEKLNRLSDQLKTKNIKVSKDKIFYKSTWNDWANLNKKAGNPVKLSLEDWNWWKKNVGEKKKAGYAWRWVEDEKSIVDLGQVIDFKSGNYLYQENLYLKLHQMALENRISTLLMNLGNKQQVDALSEGIKKSGIPLSVLDLDNAYDDNYMGNEKYMYVVKGMLQLGKPNSILLTMRNYKDFGVGQFQTYLGFSFENVANWPGQFTLNGFFRNIPEKACDLINGKLYEKGEMPPSRYF